MKTLSVIVLLCTCIGIQTNAQTLEQNVLGAAGDSFINSVAQLNYTVGELSVETAMANAVILSQGFHQTVLSVTEVTEIGVFNEIDVFPNPTQEYVLVHFHGFINENRNIQVYDLVGQLVLEEELKANQEEIRLNLADINAGQYLLTISTENNAMVNSYRIVKIN